jgi:hypothetical protein
MVILARRFTIIMLFATVFAITFSAAVRQSSSSGAQSHFGASFTCLQSGGNRCSTLQ